MLVDAQWVVLALGLALLALAKPRPRIWSLDCCRNRLRRRRRACSYVLSLWPRRTRLPASPEPLVKAFNAGDVAPDVAGMPAERVRMAERGHYSLLGQLPVVPRCRLEAAERLSAGVRSARCGRATSLFFEIQAPGVKAPGAIRELERAVRSGVSRDGRQLHWQGMTWDQLSNLEEEDLRAIVAYVRLLPPVARAVPPDRPPAADDCVTYAFYLDKTDRAGCQ